MVPILKIAKYEIVCGFILTTYMTQNKSFLKSNFNNLGQGLFSPVGWWMVSHWHLGYFRRTWNSILYNTYFPTC